MYSNWSGSWSFRLELLRHTLAVPGSRVHGLTRRIQRLKCLSYEKKLREMGLFTLEKVQCISLMSIISEGKVQRQSQALLTVRTRGTGHKLEHRNFLLNIRQHFYTVWVTDLWHTLIKVFDVPSLETFKSPLIMILCTLIWVSVLEPEELDQIITRVLC